MDKILEENSKIKGRLLQFLDNKKITKQKFCTKTGISYSNIKGKAQKSELGGIQIVKILEVFPEINPEWLLLGKGEMLRNGGVSGDNNVVGNTHCGSINTGTITSDSVQELIKQLDVKDSQLKEKDAQIKEKDAQIARLLSILEKTSK